MGLNLPIAIPALDTTDSNSLDDKVIFARLFALNSPAAWLLAEHDPAENVAFGYVDLFGQPAFAEWGYICLTELEQLRFMGIPRIEVDAHFSPKPFKDCVRADGSII